MIWKCVEFAQASISGLALLELSGVNSGQPPQVYDWGGGTDTVCQVDREPRQVPDRCFGPMSGPNWSDWQLAASGWVPRSSGVTGYAVHDGDMEGWTYSTAFGARPPSPTFSQICPPPVAAPAATPGRTSPAAIHVFSPAAPQTAPPPSPSVTPSLEALAPSATATAVPGTLAATNATPPTRSGGLPPSVVVLGAAVALLSVLLAWNLRRRGS
ncbi:MAG: hypothetical protein M3Z11_13290 [Candidatus Dormibacteraeota bacterium]|nr:hypothetical protein [Candidatus Dormibacteraeota bacterium]